MGEGNLHLDYLAVEVTTAEVARKAAEQLEQEINASYRKIHGLLAESAGESVDRIREQLAKEQELATKAALLFQGLSDLVKKASDAFQSHDLQQSASEVNIR